MKKNRVKMMTWLMIAAITAQNTVPAMAGTEPGNRAQTEDRKQADAGEGEDESMEEDSTGESMGNPSEEAGKPGEKGSVGEETENPSEDPGSWPEVSDKPGKNPSEEPKDGNLTGNGTENPPKVSETQPELPENPEEGDSMEEGTENPPEEPALSRPATPSDAEEPSGEPSEEPGGDSEKGEPGESQEEPDESPENMEPPQEESEPAFSLEGMPEMGSGEFTDWFTEHTDQEELWEYILSILERGEDKDKEYQALIGWITEHEALFSRAYQAYIGKAFELSAYRISSTGDLWDEWESVMDWDGDGTQKNPYKITTLSELMGLSEAVAQGEDFSGTYFELQSDLDLGALEANDGCWNPIGWFQNAANLGGKPKTAFKGHFDGAGNTISGLKFTKADRDYSYLGLFGWIEDAEIKNLNLEAEEVSGSDNVALLAGCVEGESVIFNVTVSGSLYAKGDAGAVAGEVTGASKSKRVVIENCRADGVVINSEGQKGFVGGISGNVQMADLADVTVNTQDGNSSRIQGKGYVGGIAGFQNEANIYNAYVSGTIGGNGSQAIGGITGLYESGSLMVAQFEGEIGKSNAGSGSHEGTFIGNVSGRKRPTYGTGKNDSLAYLYAGNAAQLKKAIGTSGQDDNTWTYDAHIGYWTDDQRRYTLTAGKREEDGKDRYYYEELEDGIQHVITRKLGLSLTEEEAPFHLDHYAPGTNGAPVLGYLVSIPRIDTKNANGTYDNDVAALTAIAATNNSYYRQIDKDHPSAVAPGCTVTVTTAAKNQNGNRYQMVYDENEPGKVKPPTYTDEAGDRQPMTYVNGGSYSFEMPEGNTELNVEYVKVTTELAITPKETEISIKQIRTGDRKNPEITTEVRDQNNNLIAKYLNGSESSEVEVLPVSIHAEHNGQGSSADRTVQWSIDDTDLLEFADGWEGGYTTKDARILPNMDSEFIQAIIREAVKAQADGGYQEAISSKVYTKSAVVTASTNPATSVDNQAVNGTCKVNVSFQISDQTTLRVEGLVLNQTSLTFDITRKLTGDRKNPTETYVVTAPYVLDVNLRPSQPFYKNVTWKTKEGEKLLTLTPSGKNEQSCQVAPVYDEKGENHPAWIQNIVNEDNEKKAADGGYRKLNGSGSVTETVTATSEDQTHGVVSADCEVTLRFKTEDQTVIHPEGIELSQTALSYDLSYAFSGDTHSKLRETAGFGVRDTLEAVVLPDLTAGEEHEPYNRAVSWTSNDPEAVSINGGTLTVKEDAPWIREAMKTPPYAAEKTVTITARTEDGSREASCDVTLHFTARAVEADRERETFEIVLTKTGRRSSPTLAWSGAEGKQLGAAIYPADREHTPVWTSSDPSVLTVTENGFAAPVVTDANGAVTAEWIRQVMQTYPYTGETEAEIRVTSPDGSMTDTVPVRLSFRIIDNTYSSGSGGGGGSSHSSGGGGGGSSSGSGSGTSSGTGTASGPGAEAPAGSVSGTWDYTADGFWTFTAGRAYRNEWAYIYNPYASEGQNRADWFRFDEAGHMVTGWFTDADGNVYYLWPASDGTRGNLAVGWQWIDRDGDGREECYYFNPVSDGTKGRLFRSAVTPDGYEVNADGAWTADGTVQTRAAGSQG